MSNTEKSARAAFDFSSMIGVGVALQKKTLEFSQINAELTLNYVKSLLASRTPSEVMQATRDFTEKQIAAFQKQAKELTDLASKKADT